MLLGSGGVVLPQAPRRRGDGVGILPLIAALAPAAGKLLNKKKKDKPPAAPAPSDAGWFGGSAGGGPSPVLVGGAGFLFGLLTGALIASRR